MNSTEGTVIGLYYTPDVGFGYTYHTKRGSKLWLRMARTHTVRDLPYRHEQAFISSRAVSGDKVVMNLRDCDQARALRKDFNAPRLSTLKAPVFEAVLLEYLSHQALGTVPPPKDQVPLGEPQQGSCLETTVMHDIWINGHTY